MKSLRSELYRDLEASALSRNASVRGATGVAAKNGGVFAQVKTAISVGTGGSAGVNFLKQALDVELFPELIDVRTALGT